MKKILPILLILMGTGAGVGAGIFLRPIPDPDAAEAVVEDTKEQASSDPEMPGVGLEYVKMNNQFVVPVVKQDKIAALMVLSLSIEATVGASQDIYNKEPKLRDAFLQVLFDHANIGGFEGSFTNANTLDVLRRGLREIAQKTMGPNIVHDILIIEIARQDY